MKLLLLLLVNTLPFAFCELVSVRIEEGELIGKTYTLDNDRKVYAFLGVPYAESPIGNRRFKNPEQLQPWEGVKFATEQGNVCLQIPYYPGGQSRQIGNEDCLYMNIFTPALPTNNLRKKMNVFVYIHGGAFMFGAGNEAYPDYILRDGNVVFVSFNYRLGPLGFFSTNNGKAPGNYGFKDQVEALRWVRRNIHHFGGNSNKVTIYGCSAGGASIHYHMISPLSENLFQKAISSSGSVLLPWSLPTRVQENSEELASSLDCESEDIEEMMGCLRDKPASEIVNEGYKYGETGHLTNIAFGPVIEPAYENDEPFLPECPHDLLKAGKVKKIPWMIGFVENEGSFLGIGSMMINILEKKCKVEDIRFKVLSFKKRSTERVPSKILEIASNDTYMKYINDHWNKIAPQIFSYDYNRDQSEQDNMSHSIKKRYLKDKPIIKQNVKHVFQAIGDRHVFCGATEAIKLHSSASPKNLFCYKFYYRGAESASDLYPNTNNANYGVCHSDDLSYIIKYGKGKSKNKNDSDMTNLLTSSIFAFMDTGNPSTSEIEWEPISKNGVLNCLVIYSYTYQRMENIENRENNRFWKELEACEG